MAVRPTYEGLYGYPLIALVLTSILYGIGILLAGQYFKSYARNDPLYVKVFIGLILLSATLQIIFTTHGAYWDFIINYENTTLFGDIVFSVPAKFMTVYLTTFFAQLFFTVRIWTLTSRIGSNLRWATIPVLALALLQFISGSIQVHLEVISDTFVELASHNPVLKPVTAIQGAATAACDLAITVVLSVIYMKYSKVSDSVSSTFEKITIYAINRAAATSICAILSVSLYYGMSGSYRFIIPCLMTGQLYLISALSVLMSSESLRDDNRGDAETGDVSGLPTKEYQSDKSSN